MSLQNLEHFLGDKSINEIDDLINILNGIKDEKVHSSFELSSFCSEYIHYIEANYSEKYCGSVKLSLKYLLEYFNDVKSIDDITTRNVEKLIFWLKEKAPKGYRVYYRNLKAAFNKAKDWEYIKENPFQKVKLGKRQKEYPAFISKDELNIILNNTNNDVLRELFNLAFYSGFRLSELVNLKWKNINYVNKLITVGDSDMPTKNRKQKTIPICDELFLRLLNYSKQWKSAVDNSEGYVFCKPNGYKYSGHYVSKSFKKTCRKIGLSEKIHFHSLRHSFATFLVQKDVSLLKVSELMGHSSIVMTQIYSHLQLDDLKQAMEVFNAVS